MHPASLAVIFALATVAGCAMPAHSASPTPEAQSDPPISVEINLSTLGDDIAFDKSSLQLALGSRYVIHFVNQATKGSAIAHNVVVLRPGSEARVVERLQAAGYDLAKLSGDPDIITSSQALSPGEHGQVVFEPTEAGAYPFLCSMPGHGDILGMKGLINVVAGGSR